VTSRDGTTIRAWRSCRAPGSLPVVISNGLGTPPEAWPPIVGDPARSDAVSWYHRGTAGAPRPADPSRLRVQDHVDDLIAVMDDRGIDRALLAGWSLGVTIAFEACRLHPDRVAGILSVAGVPGALVDAMGGPLPVPGPMRPWFATTVPRGLRMASPGLQLVSKGLPLVRPTAWAIRHTGFVLPAAQRAAALGATGAPPPRLAVVPHAGSRCRGLRQRRPVLRTGPDDHRRGALGILASMRRVIDAADEVAATRLVVLRGRHFLPLEQPEEMARLLAELAERARLAVGP